MKGIILFIGSFTLIACNIDAVSTNTGNEKLDKRIRSTFGHTKTVPKIKKCDDSELRFVQNRINNYKGDLNEKDAFILIENDCIDNSELALLHNSMIFELLHIKPTTFISHLNNDALSWKIKKQFYRAIVSPLDDKLDLDQIILRIEKLEESETKDAIIRALNIAKNKRIS